MTTKTTQKKRQGSSSKLTVKQARFVEEYLIDFNATQAAIRAGYSKKTAQRIGSENLSKPLLADIIDKSLAQKTEEADMSVRWVLDKYKTLIERCMQVVPVMELVDGDWKETGEFKFDGSVARASLADVGKYHKMFTDKVEHSGSIEVVKRDYSKG